MADVFPNRWRKPHEPQASSSATSSTSRRTASSSASTPIERPWIASSPATWPSWPRRRRSAGRISPTPSKRASTSLWRSRPPSMARPPAKCRRWPTKSVQKNLKVGVGLMIRHCRARQELQQRIQDGEIGDIICMRAYRSTGRSAVSPRPEARPTSANCSTRSSGSTASSGPAAAPSAISTSTKSTSAAG